jgi:hypothetical protein
MALAWLGFAAVVGPVTAPTGGAVAVVSGVLAAVIVLTPVGVVLALIGGGWKATLFGGICGLAFGSAPGLLGGAANPPSLTSTCLVAGALVGATLPALVRRVAQAVLLLPLALRH